MCYIYVTHFVQPEKMKHTFEHNVGLSLLSQALSDVYNIQIPAGDLDDHMDKNEYGKPYLKEHPDIHFNISHGSDIAICAVSSQNIGADIEEIRDFNPSIFRKVFTEKEKAFFEEITAKTLRENAASEPEGKHTQNHLESEWFFRFWTLKEARIKHAGMGLSMSLTSFSFTFDLNTDPYQITCSDKDVFFQQLMLEGKYILSLCVAAPFTDSNIKIINI